MARQKLLYHGGNKLHIPRPQKQLTCTYIHVSCYLHGYIHTSSPRNLAVDLHTCIPGGPFLPAWPGKPGFPGDPGGPLPPPAPFSPRDPLDPYTVDIHNKYIAVLLRERDNHLCNYIIHTSSGIKEQFTKEAPGLKLRTSDCIGKNLERVNNYNKTTQ